MSRVSVSQAPNLTATKSIISGAPAGLAGGLVFGMLLAMMGMLPMIGMLVGIDSAVIGFIVHMGISAFIGGVYGLIAGRFPLTAKNAVIGGIINGAIWWVLGGLTMMPLLLGMTEMILVIGSDQWMSLLGHLIYGLVTAFVFLPLAKRP